MKIRNDFVTNSSSSSFIIAYKELNNIEEELKVLRPQLASMIKRLLNNVVNFNSLITTKEELEEYFIGVYGYHQTLEEIFEDYSDLEERYNEWLSMIENGYSIGTRDIDYNDETSEELLNAIADGENIIILESGC